MSIRLIDPQSGLQFQDPFVDLMNNEKDATAAHYSKQWSLATGYTDFIRASPNAERHTVARQLGWARLLDRVREQATTKQTFVYDAACGFGRVHDDLFAAPVPAGLCYIGADIHDTLETLDRHERARFVRWDVSRPLPTPDKFDFVICRAAIHHTPVPAETFRSLTAVLKPGGTLAISAYAKKAPMREANDDALRSALVPLSSDEAFRIARQFSSLGRDLQSSEGEIIIKDDLPFLGIKARRYSIHEFIYDYFLKCWFNNEFGDWSDVINFDWYHPPYAYRYNIAEIEGWYRDAGLEIIHVESHKAQHYVEGSLPRAGAD
jgi:SAM-dependent methyltransferase